MPYNVSQGHIWYTHSQTSSSGTTFNINGGTTYTWTARSVGTTASSEISGCPWTAAHLHQTDSITGWSRNSSRYPSGACPNDNCGSYPVTSSGYHQTSHSWTYSW